MPITSHNETPVSLQNNDLGVLIPSSTAGQFVRDSVQASASDRKFPTAGVKPDAHTTGLVGLTRVSDSIYPPQLVTRMVSVAFCLGLVRPMIVVLPEPHGLPNAAVASWHDLAFVFPMH